MKERHIDAASVVTIVVTLLLFGVALFAKGFTHDLLLEAGVFLVSAKLVLSGYRSSLTSATMLKRLTAIEASLSRIEQLSARTGSPPPAA